MKLPKGYTRWIKLVAAFTGLLAIALGCATIVAPTGGDKDITPPEMVYSNPVNRSANFRNDRLTLTFSEYIELKDLDKYLLISPPLNKEPEMKIKSRSLIVKFKDTLRSNTTYSLYFGNGIVDITEKNPMKNFSFAFSTGNSIDSLSYAGKVADAFTRLPVKDILVMLYTANEDSLPMKERPVYVSRTGDDGNFLFSSLASGKYKIFALKDGNSDYLYNLPTEQIAFSDSLAEPYYIPVSRDTGIQVTTETSPQAMIDLFPEPDSIQRLSKGVMTSPHTMALYFRYPLFDPVFEPLNLENNTDWSVKEYSAARDTVTCWLLGTMPDTLRVKISDRGSVIDTATVATLFKSKSTDKGRKQQSADSTLRFSASTARTMTLDWEKPFLLTFANPLAYFDSTGIRIIQGPEKDTVTASAAFADPIHRRLAVNHAWQPGVDYDLLFPQGIFRDIYGQVNDSSKTHFIPKPKEDYGMLRISMNLKNIKHPLILQLLTEKDAVVKQIVLNGSQKVDFGALYPGKFRLKAIYDRNSNGRWDTGVYTKHIQPERTAYYPKVLEVRANWELEEEWNL